VQSGHSFAGIRLSIREAVIWRPQEIAASFWLLNALNLADVLLTSIALRSGLAYEANPVVTTIGMPGKVILVAGAGWLLYQLRPNALVIPIAALGLVVTWSALNLIALTPALERFL
jgi:uncharacterized protein DUF5658